MKPSIDSRIGNPVGVVLEKAEFAHNTWCGRASERELPELVADDIPEYRRDRSGNDAMCARILWMHRSIAEWQPRFVSRRRRILRDIRVTNCRNRSPEIVMVFRVEHRNGSIIAGDRRKCEEASAIYDIHALSERGLSDDWIEGTRSNQEPESSHRRLLWRPDGAVATTKFTNLIDVSGPRIGIQPWRRTGAELRAGCHNPGS